MLLEHSPGYSLLNGIRIRQSDSKDSASLEGGGGYFDFKLWE